MRIFASINWNAVRSHYCERADLSTALNHLIQNGDRKKLANIILGISVPAGNYSAHEHNLGPKIISKNPNAIDRLFRYLNTCKSIDGERVPKLIRETNLAFMRIGVGSEASCMINPSKCWITNTRSLWCSLLEKHGGNYKRADEELQMYRDGDTDSEMAYKIWSELHLEMYKFLDRMNSASLEEYKSMKPSLTTVPNYLWADAAANWLYSEHFE